MRPSDEKGVIAIIDTLPECRVVDAELNRSTKRLPQDALLMPLEEFKNSTVVRFQRETQKDPFISVTDGSPMYQASDWRHNPEFRVREEDVELVMSAAERVINERRLVIRTWNKLFKKEKAAQDIASTLSALVRPDSH